MHLTSKPLITAASVQAGDSAFVWDARDIWGACSISWSGRRSLCAVGKGFLVDELMEPHCKSESTGERMSSTGDAGP